MDKHGIRQRAKHYVEDMLLNPQYRAALDDRVITPEDLGYLALFEKTREYAYRPGHGAITQVLKAFGVMAEMDMEEAYDRVCELERKVLDHHRELMLRAYRQAN